MRFRYGILGAFLAVSGCTEDPFENSNAVVRDSAGIQIVENFGEAVAVWEILEPHRLEIGVVSGDAQYQLAGVRGVQRLSDGTIVVANEGSREVRFYDGAGLYVRSTGSQGNGPGEFEGLSGLHRFRGDSLIVVDSSLGRISILSSSGDYVRGWSFSSVPDIEPRSPVLASADDGSLIVQRTLDRDMDVSGYARERWEFLIVPNPPGTAIDLGREFGGTEFRQTPRVLPGGRAGVALRGLPFSRRSYVAAHSQGVYVGSSDTYEIQLYGFDGALRRIIRRTDVSPMQVSDAAIEWHIESRIEFSRSMGALGDEDVVRTEMSGLPRVSSLPVYDGLMVDAVEYLWIREPSYPWLNDSPGSWKIFDPDGILQATVENPPELQVFEIDVDYVLGVVTDELGVERVRLYDLVRPN